MPTVNEDMRDVLAVLASHGIGSGGLVRDGEYQSLVKSVADVGDGELRDLMSYYNSWTSYVESIVPQVEFQYDEAQADLKATAARALSGSEEKTATAKRADRDADAEVRDAQRLVNKAKMALGLVQAKARECDRNASLLSRELTWRTSNRGRA